MAETKGKSPFYPGQPVPVELFVGRAAQIDRILERGVRQVAQGKPVSMFIQGEYGIGKSSIAGFTQWVAERDHGLFGIYATLGSARSMDDLGAAVLEATVIPGRVLRSGALDPTRSDRIRSWLAKYVGEQSLFGITLHVDAVRKDAPSVTAGMLPFLGQVIERLKETGVVIAADEVGKKYVDQQVYKALHSSDYRSILKKIGTAAINGTFKKAEIAAELTETEKSKFNNFLQRMKQLRVIRSGQDRGEYTFNMRMVALYIFLESVKDAISPKSEG